MRSPNYQSMLIKRSERGFTLVEILVVVAISGLLMLSLGNVIGNVSNTQQVVEQKTELEREAAFAMRRIVRVVSRASWMTMKKNTLTKIHYDFRLDPERDMDKNGFADADDDEDGQVDEDGLGDMNGDGASGVLGVDDDGDGSVDEGNKDDDDEDGVVDEDKPEKLHLDWKNGIFKQDEKLSFDISGNGTVGNEDKLVTIISERITSFTVTTPTQTGRYAIVQVGLVLTADDGVTTTSLNTSIRLGGRL